MSWLSGAVKRHAVIAAVVVAGLGIGVGLAFLFAPLGTGCSVTATSSVPGVAATPGPKICHSYSLVQVQPVWPMPLLAVLVWSLAPTVTAIGFPRGRRRRGPGRVWIVAGLVAESTVLVSFGAAPLYVPFVLLPLLVVTAVL
ncbi:MAG: hypothetical protein M3037_15160, partial [Gemmatimonadota bacterium]|nr:hypothetical protein [Gemmatimonadota bacterium]